MEIMHVTLENFDNIEMHRKVAGNGCRSSRILPNSRQFVYIKRDPFGPHIDCDSLELYDLDSGETKELVLIV